MCFPIDFQNQIREIIPYRFWQEFIPENFEWRQSRLEIWSLRRDRFDSQNQLISRFVLTTVGRVVMNYTIIDSVSKT